MLMGPADGSAYFSNFSVRAEKALDLGPSPRQDIPPGFIRAWQVSQVLPALENRLLGVAEGAQMELAIPSEEAFGEVQPQLVEHRAFHEFPRGRDLVAGKWVVAVNEDTNAQYSYFVREKTEDAVVLDFNHPLAGKVLYYSIKVVKVRPASAEELVYLRPCQTG